MKKEIQIRPIQILVVATVLVAGFLIIRKITRNPKKKLQEEAKKDREFWKNKAETHPSVSDTLVDYWKTAGLNFKPSQMQSASFHSSMPWSSAYVSNLIIRGGYKNFKGSSSHAQYVVEAKKNRKENKNNSFWAYKPSEGKKVEVGDILVKPRSGSNPSLDTINGSTPTHGDVVIDTYKKDGKFWAKAQGGNLSNTVSADTVYELTSDGKIKSGSPLFAHLKYKF